MNSYIERSYSSSNARIHFVAHHDFQKAVGSSSIPSASKGALRQRCGMACID